MISDGTYTLWFQRRLAMLFYVRHFGYRGWWAYPEVQCWMTTIETRKN